MLNMIVKIIEERKSHKPSAPMPSENVTSEQEPEDEAGYSDAPSLVSSSDSEELLNAESDDDEHFNEGTSTKNFFGRDEPSCVATFNAGDTYITFFSITEYQVRGSPHTHMNIWV